ncbi:MAG: hypothetical protein AABY22_24595 [Nanoarchaeota archaeon]
MGKNSSLKTLGKRIGNIVLHKMLIKYTNKPESISHLINEENEYRAAAIIDAKKFNWNEGDKQELRIIAIGFFENKSIKKYFDVNLPLEEAKTLIDQEIINLKL